LNSYCLEPSLSTSPGENPTPWILKRMQLCASACSSVSLFPASRPIYTSMKSFACSLTLLCAISAFAQIHTDPVDYKDGDTTLEGWLTYDGSIKGKRPGVLIVHQWKGLTDFEKKRADMLAKLGYVVFAVDIYGKGIRLKDTQQAGAEAGKYKKN